MPSAAWPGDSTVHAPHRRQGLGQPPPGALPLCPSVSLGQGTEGRGDGGQDVGSFWAEMRASIWWMILEDRLSPIGEEVLRDVWNVGPDSNLWVISQGT